jgi:predicted secreted hydrolase
MNKALSSHPLSLLTLSLIALCLTGCAGRSTPTPTPSHPPFPTTADHGTHNKVAEWWYFTGDLQTDTAARLGYELTVFKAVLPQGTFFVWHLAATDLATSRHTFVEAASDESVGSVPPGQLAFAYEGFGYAFSEDDGFHLTATTASLSADLRLKPTHPPLPHGEDGNIAMGDGRDSAYYSFTNLATEGTLVVDGVTHAVSGRSWMDHQWGNFTEKGLWWDWFSLRLDDGGALMLFQFRDETGAATRSSWTFRGTDGAIRYGEALTIQAARTFEDPDAVYPIDWTVEVPDLDATLRVRPLLDAQSLYGVSTPSYWEGLCTVEGTLGGAPVSGSAFVELTGYEKVPRESQGHATPAP